MLAEDGCLRKPKKPPMLHEIDGIEDDFLEKLSSPEVTEFVRKANNRYLHWDKMRHLQRPDGLSAEHAWAAIRFSRMSQIRQLPLSMYHMNQKMGFWIPPKHQQWLHEIDQKAGGSIGAISDNELPDDNERYLINSLMEEAIASSRLEGASSTREKAKKMLRTERKPRDRSEQMILNNFQAILEIRDLKNDKLTPDLLCHLQEVLTAGTLDDPTGAGRFRTNEDNVQVVEQMTDEVMHEPPDAATIRDRLDQLCAFANRQSGSFIHPVIKAMILHFSIGFIHPFVDGNGRTARAVFYWYMLKRGYWLFEYLPLSRILITGPAQYERAYLYAENDGGDVTYFNHFHLKIICQAIRELHEYITQQAKEVREATRILKGFPGLNHRQVDVVHDCLKHPDREYTIAQHKGSHRVSYATARSDLYGLEKQGFLIRQSEKYKAVFSSPQNLLARIKCTPKSKLAEQDYQEEFRTSDEIQTDFF